MNGKKALLDSNIIIYLSKQELLPDFIESVMAKTNFTQQQSLISAFKNFNNCIEILSRLVYFSIKILKL